MFYAATRSNYENTADSIKLGLFAAVSCFVFIGMLQFPDGPFVRPSKPIWRAVLSLSVLYQLCLVFLLFLVRLFFFLDPGREKVNWAKALTLSSLLLLQNKDDARQFMKYYDPTLGVELPERSYAEACTLSTENVLVSSLFWLESEYRYWPFTHNLEPIRYLCHCTRSWLVW